ncbi:MAG: SpoIIE family protein phosphatase [Planctomycetes bacterium]|nr:SpoIIE family protein phosphatase [Planctomycetota bacterium]
MKDGDGKTGNRRRIMPSSRMMGAGETRQLLSALVHLASELNGTLDLPELLSTVMTRAKEVMDAEASSIMFLDRSEGVLTCEVALSPVGEQLKRECKLRIGEGVAGHVAKTGQPYLTNSPYESEYFSKEQDQATGFRTRNILCVPLTAKGELLGVAQVLNRRNERSFTEDDCMLFQAFADMAAVAISNANLHQEAIEKRKMEREMSVARDIQNSFLPEAFPEIPGLSFDATMKAAMHVGGDFYDIFTTTGGNTCVVVGDVSGKGTSAALYMACLHSELRLAIEYESSPEKVLKRLNEIMFKRSRRGAFISLVFAIFDPAHKEVDILSAGHPEPVIYDSETKRAETVNCSNGFPLGVVQDTDYVSTRIRFPAGSHLILYTDGIIESRNESDIDFGQERLCECVDDAISTGSSPIERIQEGIRVFSGQKEQYDDLTIVSVKSE